MNIRFNNIRQEGDNLFFEFTSNYRVSLHEKLTGKGTVNLQEGLIYFQHKLLGNGKVKKEVMGSTTMITITAIDKQKWLISK